MTLVTEIVLWTSLAGVFFVYFVYPATLVVLARIKKGEWFKKGSGIVAGTARRVLRTTIPDPFLNRQMGTVPFSHEFPRVTLIISAYDEAAVMRDKIENSLALDYPPDKLAIMVISDASTDGTDEIAQSYSNRGVLLHRQNPRGGKSLGLTQYVPTATGEIIVFSDANSMYEPDAIRHLVRHFADPAVGFVAGHQRYVDDHNAASVSESMYWRYETFLKSQESRIGSVVCGDGAIYAIRAQLFEPLREDDINDFTLPLKIIARGYRGIFDPEAICYEHAAADFLGEFRRKVRIVNRSLRAVCRVPQSLNPFRVGLFAYQLAVHKVSRWFVPFMLIVALAANAFLALSTAPPPSPQPSPPAAGGEGWVRGADEPNLYPSQHHDLLSARSPYGTLLLLQSSFYALALLGFVPHVRRMKPVYLASYFCMVNLAAFLGVLGVVFGKRIITWSPERSQPQSTVSSVGS